MRCNLLDVDRVIGVTAVSTILVGVLLSAMLTAVPAAPGVISRPLESGPGTIMVALSVLLASILAPAYGRLRPQVDRLFFSHRYAVEQGIDHLLSRIRQCSSLEALTDEVGQGLDDVFHPRELRDLRARAGGFFTGFRQREGRPSGHPLLWAPGRLIS